MSEAAVSAGAALLCTTLRQHLSTRQSELYSELLCWITLPLLFKAVQQPKSRTHHKAAFPIHDSGGQRASLFFSSYKTLWVVASGITVATVYKTEYPVIEFFVSDSEELCTALFSNQPIANVNASSSDSSDLSTIRNYAPYLVRLLATHASQQYNLGYDLDRSLFNSHFVQLEPLGFRSIHFPHPRTSCGLHLFHAYER